MFSRATPLLLGERDPLFEPEIDLDQHVVVARILLHHFGSALVMHQDDRHVRCGGDLSGTGIIGERGNVVDHLRPGFDCRRHDVSLARVDRYRRPACR